MRLASKFALAKSSFVIASIFLPFCFLKKECKSSSEVIDVKGFKTKEYIAKKKVFEDKYNLKIIEL